MQKPLTAPGVSPSAALRRRLGVLCVLESGEKCSLKILPGNILAVLAFGAVSLRVLDLGIPYGSLPLQEKEALHLFRGEQGSLLLQGRGRLFTSSGERKALYLFRGEEGFLPLLPTLLSE